MLDFSEHIFGIPLAGRARSRKEDKKTRCATKAIYNTRVTKIITTTAGVNAAIGEADDEGQWLRDQKNCRNFGYRTSPKPTLWLRSRAVNTIERVS